jgi:ABC-type sulfate/molybdate transport systems ATPase subunit
VERQRRTEEVLVRLGLEGLGDRHPGELSGGQRQRVALGRALAPDPALLLLDEPLSALDLPLRRALRDELRTILTAWGTAAVLVTHDFTEAYRLGDRIVVYEDGRVIQAAPRAELLWQPASRAVARVMGLVNVLEGTVLKASPDRIQFRWRGQSLEAVNSPSRSYLPAPDSPLGFFVRPEYVRLIRKDRGLDDPAHHMNVMTGRVVREIDFGTTWTLQIRLDEPGEPAQGDFDLEVEVPRLVYEILEIERDRHWRFSIHRGSIHVLPSS